MRANVNSIELGGVTNLSVLAPIQAGFVPGFETITYLERLRRLLKALHAARQNVRESELRKPVFPDSIGRFGIIHSFRYAIVSPPDEAASGREHSTSLLSLNVTFDGGWEPYMRVIHRDIGTLLDALFCHCTDYPGSTGSFDAYCRWVRDRELDGGIFYTDSSMSLGDQRYLERVERIQRETPVPGDADRKIAELALPSEPQQIMQSFAEARRDPRAALALPVRTLKGLYRLAPFFPANAAHDDRVLIRFAQSVLKEFGMVIQDPAVKDSLTWQQLEKALADELAWFGTKLTSPPPADRPAYKPDALQAAVLGGPELVSHGCVVLLRVGNAGDATAHLTSLAAACAVAPSATTVQHHVTFTYGGMAALGISAERLDALPQEFMEGMEARCGTLGDVRTNHPDRWSRPLPDAAGAAAGGEPIDLTNVHVVVVMRLADPADKRTGLHPVVGAAVDALRATKSGLEVLSVQPTRSYRNDKGVAREHFGFLDGFSQPKVVTTEPPAARSDEVRPGELLLGHATDRGDEPALAPDPLLHNGSFLVMRKLRQNLDTLNAALDAALDEPLAKDEAMAKMMGRDTEGRALAAPNADPASNSFNYDHDAKGAACPFHSHVRRANPRDGRPYMPRILRRGMSYGPRVSADADAKAERGIVFMAYCASIAEQFETIQRWIAGGNSSGVSSSQADPFLAVPQRGEKRIFRYLDAAGRVVRVDLGDKPIVKLEWGLYLFAPSLEALKMLGEFRRPLPKSKELEPAPEPDEKVGAWRRRLEDPDRSEAEWKEVRREHDGRMEAPPYGTLVGTKERVLAVLKDTGTKYSVQGYGTRMAQSIGLNYLGMDPGGDHAEQAPYVNAAIERIDSRKAFEDAADAVKKVMKRFMLLAQKDADGPTRVPVDLISLSEGVLAELCRKWIGLPEDDKDVPAGESPFMVPGTRIDGAGAPPRCPGHLLTASRFTFAPHPRPDVLKDGPTQGQKALEAVESLLASSRPLGPLAADIQASLVHIAAAERQAVVARSIAGVLLGFPPTVHGNFMRTLKTLLEEDKTNTLWTWQQRLAAVPASVDAFDRAVQALREPMLETMCKHPVPEMLWRCPVVKGEVVHDEDKRVVLGIASALADGTGPHELMFGGSRDAKSDFNTVHACPGYSMAIGVLLALFAGLLGAGTLRPTGSTALLMLTPRAN